MGKLSKSSERWVDAGLIDADLRRRILDFESNRPGRLSAGRLMSIAALAVGALAIALGIGALVAANWDDISGTTKLVAHFTLNAAVAYGIYTQFEHRKPWILDAGILLLSVLTLTLMALIGQVFQVSGSAHVLVTVWFFVISPLALIGGRGKSLMMAWALGAFALALSWWLDYGYFSHRTSYRAWQNAALALVPLSMILAGFNKKLSQLHPNLGAALREVGILLTCVGLVVNTHPWGITVGRNLLIDVILPNLLIWLLLIGVSTIAKPKTFSKGGWLAWVGGLGLLSVSCQVIRSEFYAALAYIMISSGIGWLALKTERKRIAHIALWAVIIRLIVMYFQAIKSLSLTGTGLILSGVVILGAAVLGGKISTNLERRIKEKQA